MVQSKYAGIAGEVDGKPMPIGTWWWNLNGIKETSRGVAPEKAMEMLCENHVTEIYLDVSGMYSDGEHNDDPYVASFSEVQAFIRRCGEHGIRVSALTGVSRDGVKKWIDPERGYPEINRFIDKIAFYNAFSEPEERFFAAHIDVEPHSVSDFQQKRAEYFTQYAMLMQYLSERLHFHGLRLETDVCGDLRETDIVELNGGSQKLLDAVFDACDTVVVMAYRHRAERQMEFGTNRYLPYADKHGTRLMVGSETMLPCDDPEIDDIPPSITYAAVGREAMLDEMKKLQRLLLETKVEKVGIAVHHVHSWYPLFYPTAG